MNCKLLPKANETFSFKHPSTTKDDVTSVFHASTISVILRRYSLPEVPRRRIHNVIAHAMSMFFKHPSPEAYASTSPSGGEVLNNALQKGLDVVRQYASKLIETAESGVDKVVSSCEKNPSVHKRYMNFLRQRKTALDALLYAVSSGRLRSQCAPDAKEFLSDVYKSSTLAKKLPADGVQCGRSMIEMLGVLAIIGVMSVGGIAGFSKMLAHQKIMQTQEQVNAIAAKLSTVGAEASSFSGLSNKTAVKFGAIPSEAIIDAKKGTLQNPYGGDIQIVATSAGDAYVIAYNKIPKDACMNLASQDWGGKNSSFQRIFIVNTKTANIAINDATIKRLATITEKNNDKYTIRDAKDKPLTPPEAAATCSQCQNNDCSIGLVFN